MKHGAGVEIRELKADGGPARRWSLLSAERDRTRGRRVPLMDGWLTLSPEFVVRMEEDIDEEDIDEAHILAVLITCFAVGTVAAQSCDSKAVSANEAASRCC